MKRRQLEAHGRGAGVTDEANAAREKGRSLPAGVAADDDVTSGAG
eukprot:CAMPEP_0119382110 /NCGR_PEP_ID=MMETSP1334-20130426/69716_1 /TAXON_ID=127549 /ORGANISM="Calcidiscus leptoporus, Strain RCC1130" /LENGTH=44 /DNA_ID= /DNA_START= /DNA_END= /DNA_ORIENTATION=